MSLAVICAVIETHETAALANAGSSLRVVLEQAWDVPEIRRLAALVGRRAVAASVVRRIIQLVDQETDLRFENPNDIALLIYAWLLARSRSAFALWACSAILQGRNLWWSSRYAHLVLSGRLESNQALTYSTGRPVPNRANDLLIASWPGRGIAAALLATVSSVSPPEKQAPSPHPAVYGVALGRPRTATPVSAATTTTTISEVA